MGSLSVPPPSQNVVLHQVSHVKYKKTIGTLYLLHDKLIWSQQQGNPCEKSTTHSHQYSDIQSQKVSPDNHPKIQLQIVLLDNSTFTYHFVVTAGENGTTGATIASRNNVKELLAELLGKFKRIDETETDLERKSKLLAERPGTLKLYKDLVPTDIVKATDFWKIYVKIPDELERERRQETGVSSGFLSKTQTLCDGDKTTYHLNPDVISSIFKTYPPVEKKYRELVPIVMTQEEFWMKFFESHYYHPDCPPLPTDLFYSCAKSDEKEFKRAVQWLKETNTDIINLVSDPEKSGSEAMEDEPLSAGGNIIKRLNQHSFMILNAMKPNDVSEEPPKKKSKTNVEDTTDSGLRLVQKPESPEELNLKKAKLLEKIQLEDLIEPQVPQFQKLTLTQVDRYQNGPELLSETEQISHDELMKTVEGIRRAIPIDWANSRSLLFPEPDPNSPLQLVGDLSPCVVWMNCNEPNETLPEDLKQEIRSAYNTLSELLRPFWHSFKFDTDLPEENVKETTYAAIKKFEQTKLQDLKDRLIQDQLPTKLLDHLYCRIAAAEKKYHD